VKGDETGTQMDRIHTRIPSLTTHTLQVTFFKKLHVLDFYKYNVYLFFHHSGWKNWARDIWCLRCKDLTPDLNTSLNFSYDHLHLNSAVTLRSASTTKPLGVEVEVLAAYLGWAFPWGSGRNSVQPWWAASCTSSCTDSSWWRCGVGDDGTDGDVSC